MDQTNGESNSTTSNQLPFDNLYLNSGIVNGNNKGWTYFLTLILLILGYLTFQLMIMYPLLNLLKQNGFSEKDLIDNPSLIFDYKALKIDRNMVFALELGMFVFACGGFFIGLKRAHQKSLTSVLTGYQKFRFKQFWFAFALWSLFLIIAFFIGYFSSKEDYEFTFNPLGLTFSIIIMALMMPFQTGIEETIFRGYLIQGLAQIFRNGILPLIITSLLFAGAHMTNPEVKEYGWGIMFTYYFAFAVFMGAITLIDEGLELAFGIHLANNMVSSILISTPHSVVKPYSLFQTSSENPETEIIIWLVMAILSFVIFKLKFRWTNLKLIIK